MSSETRGKGDPGLTARIRTDGRGAPLTRLAAATGIPRTEPTGPEPRRSLTRMAGAGPVGETRPAAALTRAVQPGHVPETQPASQLPGAGEDITAIRQAAPDAATGSEITVPAAQADQRTPDTLPDAAQGEPQRTPGSSVDTEKSGGATGNSEIVAVTEMRAPEGDERDRKPKKEFDQRENDAVLEAAWEAAESTVIVGASLPAGVTVPYKEGEAPIHNKGWNYFGDAVGQDDDRYGTFTRRPSELDFLMHPMDGLQEGCEAIAIIPAQEPVIADVPADTTEGVLRRIERTLRREDAPSETRREAVGKRAVTIVNPLTGEREFAREVHYAFDRNLFSPTAYGPDGRRPAADALYEYQDYTQTGPTQIMVQAILPLSVADNLEEQIRLRSSTARKFAAHYIPESVMPPYDSLPPSWRLYVVTPSDKWGDQRYRQHQIEGLPIS